MPVSAGVLKDSPKNCAGIKFFWSTNNDIDIEWLSTRLHHGNILWVTVLVNKKATSFRLGYPLCHDHRFRRRGCFVKQRGIGDFQSREVRYDRLKI